VDVTFDALMGQHLSAIDQHLGFTVNFDSVVGNVLHDSLDLGTVRIVALAVGRVVLFTGDI